MLFSEILGIIHKTHNNRFFIIPAQMVCNISGGVHVNIFDFIPMGASK